MALKAQTRMQFDAVTASLIFAALIIIIVFIGIIISLLMSSGGGVAFQAAAPSGIDKLGKFIGAGLAIGLAAIGAGLAIGIAGASGLSAMAEKPELFGRVFLIIVLAEGLGIYGLIVSILLILLGG
ncbi:MAG: V-type ATP synthase subunit K [Sulfolobales archaeon]